MYFCYETECTITTLFSEEQNTLPKYVTIVRPRQGANRLYSTSSWKRYNGRGGRVPFGKGCNRVHENTPGFYSFLNTLQNVTYFVYRILDCFSSYRIVKLGSVARQKNYLLLGDIPSD